MTCIDIAAATAALVGAPLDPAALTSAANGLAAAVAAARAAAVFSVREALHYGGLTAPEYFGALDRSAAVEAAAAGALEALTARASEVGLVADGAAEHRDQVNSFGGGHPDEVVAEAWAAADAWVAAAGALRDARDKVAEVTPCGAAAAMAHGDHAAALTAAKQIFNNQGRVHESSAIGAAITTVTASLYTGWHEDSAYSLSVMEGAFRSLLDDPASGVAGEAAIFASAAAASIRREWLNS